jgi:hypothetical protein
MSTYRVMFFKTLPNSYGKMFEVCQRTIDIPSASNPDSAVEQAKRQFQQCEDISDWRIHADYFQVDVLATPTRDDSERLHFERQRCIGHCDPRQRQPSRISHTSE